MKYKIRNITIIPVRPFFRFSYIMLRQIDRRAQSDAFTNFTDCFA